MHLKNFVKYYGSHPALKELLAIVSKNDNQKVTLKGLCGSSLSLLYASLYNAAHLPSLIILNDLEEAAYFYDELISLGIKSDTLFFPSSYKRSVKYKKIDSENIILRTDVLNKLSKERHKYTIITYPEALMEKVVSHEGLDKHTLGIRVGEKLSIQFIDEVLTEYGFEQVDFVYGPGQYSIRGSIIDIFSFSHEDPYRVDFSGNEVDSIRVFDTETQLSKEEIKNISIIPNIKEGLQEEKRISFFSFLKKQTIIIARDFSFVKEHINSLYNSAVDVGTENSTPVSNQLISGSDTLGSIENFTCVESINRGLFPSSTTLHFNTSKQPLFHKNFDLLEENLRENTQNGYTSIILSSNPKQIERLKSIFKDKGSAQEFDYLFIDLHEGFIDHDIKICCYTNHQIFERYHRFKLRSKKSFQHAIALKELNKLHQGDYVVHIDHGIGKFAGLVKSEVNGKIQESIRLVYKNNDSLLVKIHSLHRISKYKGQEGVSPKINQLGTVAWQNKKNKTKQKAKDIARELIALYAKRKKEKGFAFSPDTYMQQELETSFIYEDTPDQLRATLSVKEDMERSIPMDRLVCGDVGFGKTEVAIRAAFKAATDNKQVAVLVPTTILALQHYKTFSERLKEFPCRVEYISRLRKPAEINRVLDDLSSGKLDIIIGTYKLVGKNVKFKNLGLLIVDEEQRFGVSAKEKLKQLKVNVDSLTLTATPIPRTLQFSLMGARDLSIINTPPPNRYPIVTELHRLNEDIIREAIMYEASRGGQVFFIHNRVQNIYEVEALINRICPTVRTAVGHGQMKGDTLEGTMLSFINGDYDLLVATTIIESGLDIPNVNTIIINNAHNFGLSELHQLRGRVGRSNKKAFCYLLSPPLETLVPEARQRLRAIEEFSDLGSGFNIATRDLDIRGAGNLIGAEQSGFISDIGFEVYHKILDEALQELRNGEFKDIFKDETDNTNSHPLQSTKFVSDCQIDTDFELHFPTEYISNTSERMLLYRDLDNMKDDSELCQFKEKLIDRFGPIPKASKELIEVVKLRWIAIRLSVEKMTLKNRKMICYLPANQESLYYRSQYFKALLQWMVSNPDKGKMKETKDKLYIIFNNIDSIGEAMKVLEDIGAESMHTPNQ